MEVSSILYTPEGIAAHVCLACVSGSRAYGLDTPESDYDEKGVYMAPAEDVLTGRALKVVQDERHDVQYTEIGEFCRLLEQNNCAALELWACMGEPQERMCAAWFRDFLRGRRVLSKLCFHTFTGNAEKQMKRMNATREKALMPEPPAAAGLAEYAQALCAGEAVPLLAWLARQQMTQHDVVARPVAGDVWALYAQHLVCGLFGRDGTCVAGREPEQGAAFLAYMVVDTAGWRAHCRRVAQYREWEASRNATRLNTDASLPPGEGTYDTKHMSHVIRLLRMAREIATEGRMHVRRTYDNAFLREVRAGRYAYSAMVELVEREVAELRVLFERSGLPDKPQMGDWMQDLALIRLNSYESR